MACGAGGEAWNLYSASVSYFRYAKYDLLQLHPYCQYMPWPTTFTLRARWMHSIGMGFSGEMGDDEPRGVIVRGYKTDSEKRNISM